jgi:glycosyltransferase involved in cell wall biosynthesis
VKILVFADRLEFGGTQVNAIELTEALRDLHGHEVVLFATPGPMARVAEEKGIRVLPAPWASAHPSLAVMSTLREAVRREKPDLIHLWDWTQCMDAYYSVHLPMRIPMVVTVMTMDLPRLLPKALPTTLGTPELLEQARAAGRKPLELILPPVDIHRNAPEAADGAAFRAQYDIRVGEVALVTVSRLVKWMKAESLLNTIRAVGALAGDLPLRLIIVGDGTARAELERLAETTNSELGKQTVIMTGALLDPRPAYAAADIVVGMGGSALRGMAFSKPVVIVGEKGFSAPFNNESATYFYNKGIYGVGDGTGGYERLLENIRNLAGSPASFAELGDFSRKFVQRFFSVEKVSAKLSAFCEAAAVGRPRLEVAIADGIRTAAVAVGRNFIPGGIRQRLKAGKGEA